MIELTDEERSSLRLLRRLESECHALELRLIAVAEDALAGKDNPAERVRLGVLIRSLYDAVDAVPLTSLDLAYCAAARLEPSDLLGPPSKTRQGRAARVLDMTPDGTFLLASRRRTNPARVRSLN